MSLETVVLLFNSRFCVLLRWKKSLSKKRLKNELSMNFWLFFIRKKKWVWVFSSQNVEYIKHKFKWVNPSSFLCSFSVHVMSFFFFFFLSVHFTRFSYVIFLDSFRHKEMLDKMKYLFKPFETKPNWKFGYRRTSFENLNNYIEYIWLSLHTWRNQCIKS